MSDSSLASDIITYVGVPLAVLGVLPIMYNTLATLAALSRVRRMLRSARLTALTRSDIVNRIIEVDLPRYAVTPHHRSHPPAARAAYWTLAPYPSAVPGGSWTVFNWRATAIGVRTQRIEYADQLRQPQCEVGLEDLVCYLLDLGAVPDPRGWRMLRNAGLWTPVGCCLMRAPGGDKALTVAPGEDSEGHLSLSVVWEEGWTARDHLSLPPYWVRLPGPGRRLSPEAAEIEEAGEGSDVKKTPDVESAEEALLPMAIVCKISDHGLVTAHHEDDAQTKEVEPGVEPELQPSTPSLPSRAPTLGLDTTDDAYLDDDIPPPYVPSLPVSHLATYPGTTAGVWFASAATAYGTTPGTVLWNYRIPDPLLAFCRKESVPCGVLEVLGLVDASATPEWRSHAPGDDPHTRNVELLSRRLREQRLEMEKESRMKPEERSRAVRERMQREAMQRLEDHRDNVRAAARDKEERLLDAIHSPKWSPAQLAPHALRWLQRHQTLGHLFAARTDTGEDPVATGPPRPGSLTTNAVSAIIKPYLGPMLHTLVLDASLAATVVAALDAWRTWADKGGMRREDLDRLMSGESEAQDGGGLAPSPAAALAMASLMAAVIGSVSEGGHGLGGPGIGGPAAEASLGADLREALRMWPKVRLG